MERLIDEITRGLRALRESGWKTIGWEFTMYVREGKKKEILDYYRFNSILDKDILDEGCIMIDGSKLKIVESRGLIMIDTSGTPEKQVRASALTASQYMLV